MAKSIDYSTTGISQNAPGLTSYNPKETPASVNSLGSAIKGITDVIPAIVETDKQGVLGEASDLANKLSSEYKPGSETHLNNLNQEKLRLQSDMSKGDPNDTVINERINEINSQLTLAQNQGLIGPGEMKHRMMKAGQDLASENPAYQAEIAAKMNAVFGATGVTQLLATDSTLLQTRVSAAIARKKSMRTEVEKFQSTENLNDDQLEEAFNYYNNITGHSERVKITTENLKNADELVKRQAYVTFKTAGGFTQLAQGTYANIMQRVRAIGSSDRPIDQKIREVNDAIIGAEQEILSVASSLPSDATEGSLITNHLLKNLQGLKQEMLDESNQASKLTIATNGLKLLQTKQEMDLAKNIDMPSITAAFKLTKIAEGISPLNTKFETIKSNIMQDILTNLEQQLGTSKVIDVDSAEGDGLATEEGRTSISTLAKRSYKEGLKDLETNGTLAPEYTKLYVNDLALTTNSATKDTFMKHADKYFGPNMLSMPDKILDTLESDTEWLQSFDNYMNRYTVGAQQGLISIVGEDSIQVGLSSKNKMLYITPEQSASLDPVTSMNLKNALNRVNNIIKINSKVSGKSLEEESKKVLQEDFPFFEFVGAK